MSEENQEPQGTSLEEIQMGLFNLTVNMYMEYAREYPADVAKALTSGYLQSLILGLVDQEDQEENTDD